MRGSVATLLFAASVVATALPRHASATPLFLLDTDEQSYALIHRVDQQTGQLTTLGSLPVAGTPVGLAAASGNLFYAVSWSGAVHRITVAPFTVTLIGDVGRNGIVGLAYAGGVLHATEEHTGFLARIDPTTAAITWIGAIELPDGTSLSIVGGDLAQAADGTWLLWTNSTQTLYTLDVTAAVATPVPAQVLNNGWRTGLAVAYQEGGTLFTSSADLDALVITDPSSGAPADAVPFCLQCPTRYDVAFGDLASPRCTDVDGDGFAADGGACGPVDCDDTIGSVNPLGAEACNGRDDDCDGGVDEGASASCNDGNACTIGDACQAGACRPGASRNCGLLNLVGAKCRVSDGACCGRLLGGFLPGLSVCLR